MSKRLSPQRSSSAAARIPPTSFGGMPSGRHGPGRWTVSRCWAYRVFAVLDMPLDDLLRRRFTSFRTIYVPTAGQLAESRFELLPTGQRPHFTVRLRDADAPELDRLLKALGAAQPNPQYARGMIWREEG